MDGLSSLLGKNYVVSAISIGVTILITVFALAIVRRLKQRVIKSIEDPSFDPQRASRLRTLIGAGANLANVIILAIAILIILSMLGINITPILASVGVAGLALSLGAQTVIKDYIGGVLILFENQFVVGDVVTFDPGGDAVTGTVEKLTLRTTYLRDLEGRQVIVPNGDVRILSNANQTWARAVVDVQIAYEADMNQALQTLEAAMQKAAQDTAIQGALQEIPQVIGWNSFTDLGVQVRLQARTVPERRIDVAVTMRRYALQALQEAGIEVPRRR